MMLFPEALLVQARAVLSVCRQAGLTVATAESCTGGLISAVLTEIPGSSAVVDRTFVTYSNGAKHDLLGVSADLLKAQGAVAEPVARAMVAGALACSTADIAVAVTGIAGPGGGSATKPVGLVHLAAARRGQDTVLHRQEVFAGDRTEVRLATVATALSMLLTLAGAETSG